MKPVGKWQFIGAAVTLSVLYWLFEALEDTYIHMQGSLWENAFAAVPWPEVLSRLFIIATFFGFVAFLVAGMRRRYQAERIARQNEELLRHMIDEVPLLMDAMDKQGILKVWNKQCEKITGYTADEVVDNPDIMKKFYPDEAYRAKRIAQRSNKANHYKDYHWNLVRKDGEVRIISWSNFTVDLPVKGWATWSVGRDITDQLQKEKRLRESERRFATLLGNLPGMAYRCSNDKDWTMEFVSQGCRSLTGYEAGDLIGSKTLAYNDLIHPDDRDMVWESIQDGLSRDEHFRIRYRIITRKGETKWVFEQGIGVAGENGGDLMVEGLISDITPQVAAETALRESEERFRRLAENAKDMIYRMHLPEGSYEYVSPASTEVVGYEPDRLYANPLLIQDAIAPGWAPYFEREWKALLEGSMSPTYEYQILHPQKGLRWLYQRNVLLKDDDGNPMAIEGIVTDITARKHMEEALRESEHRFRQLAEHMQEVIWLAAVTPEPAMLYVNRTVETMFGISREELYSHPDLWMQHIHEDDLSAVNERIQCYLTGNCNFDITFRIHHPEDGLRWIESRFIPIADASGTMYRSVGICRDITRQIREEEQRKALEVQLRHQQKLESIGTLASGVAHEINNPLNIVMNYAQLILDLTPDGSDVECHAREIFSESERIASIVRNLLSFSRYEQRQRELADLAATVETTLSLTRSLMHKDNIEVVKNISQGIPSVHCHRQQIQQVIMNLLTNARDALNHLHKEAGRQKSITVELSSFVNDDAPWVRMTVADNGPGIEMAIQERIFDPFFTSKTRDKGTGLGLSISHGIVEEHSGRLWFETESGKGTSFHMDLPVGEDQGESA